MTSKTQKTPTLADVAVVPWSIIEALAAEAPAGAEADPAPARPPGGGARSGKHELGALSVPAYLEAHGIGYRTKDRPTKTIYALRACPFDPDHGQDASIIQDRTGKLSFHCFHDGCEGRTWAQVRRQISGDASLAEFCEGFDPNWKPAAASPKKTPKDQAEPAGPGPFDFLEHRPGKRPVFHAARMANFVEDEFKPLLFEGAEFGNSFFRYLKDRGVWTWLAESRVRKFIRTALGDDAKAEWIRGSLQLLQDQTFLEPEEIESDPMWLNVRNGMLHLETRELRPHAPEFYSRVQVPVTYNEKAKMLRWEDALAEIFADDFEKIQTLQQFFGYCLYPAIVFPAALFQIGQGRNGKGVVERILCAMLGEENVCHLSLKRMEDRFGPAEIRGKLLNTCSETETGSLDVTKFKAIAAGDWIQAEVKYDPDVKFRPIAKHLISMNSFPRVQEKTNAFFRRLVVLEYKQTFTGNRDDKRLAERLIEEELDGIFLWALEGLVEVLKNEEILEPASVQKAKERFRQKTNPMLGFVEEMCVVGGEGNAVLPRDLYKAYCEWAEDGKTKPLGKTNFYEQVYLNFPDVEKQRRGTKEFFVGIGLLEKDYD